MEGISQESDDYSHFIFIIETTDRIQKFIDRVLSSEEILKRNEWKKPFWINIDYDLNSVLKSVEALHLINTSKNNVQMREDLLKIKGAGKEILAYSEDFLNHSFEDCP